MKQFLKTKFRNAVRARGWDFVKGPNLMDFLRSRSVDLVFDIGANQGDYALQIRRWGYKGEIISLEPTRAAYDLAVKAAAKDSRWHVLQKAAGATPGSVEIRVSKNSKFSSMLGQTAAADIFDPNMAIDHVEQVPVIQLDSLQQEYSFENCYLKIDTQGFEQAVLAGAQNLMKRCAGIQLELPIEHLYEGVWNFEEALGYMRERGFVPAQFSAVTAITSDLASVTEFDCVFRKA
jgi:FkbM family methyltransferase